MLSYMTLEVHTTWKAAQDGGLFCEIGGVSELRHYVSRAPTLLSVVCRAPGSGPWIPMPFLDLRRFLTRGGLNENGLPYKGS